MTKEYQAPGGSMSKEFRVIFNDESCITVRANGRKKAIAEACVQADKRPEEVKRWMSGQGRRHQGRGSGVRATTTSCSRSTSTGWSFWDNS